MTPFAVNDHTGEWVAAGLISPAQARALEEFEATQHAAEEPARPTRLGSVAEAGAYVGTVLALVGGGIGLGPQWGDMALALRLVIAGAIAATGLLTGRWLMGVDEAGTRRLGGFLWVLAAAGLALAGGTVMNEVRPDSPWMAISIGLPGALLGAALWRDRDRPLQLLTLAAGSGIAAGGFLALADLAAWHGAAPVWLAGAAWWVLTARGTVRPAGTARIVGALTMIVGAFMLSDLRIQLGAAVALATAAALIVLALRGGYTSVLVVSVLAALEAVRSLVETTFHGPVGGAFVALAGLTIVVVIVLHARRRAAA